NFHRSFPPLRPLIDPLFFHGWPPPALYFSWLVHGVLCRWYGPNFQVFVLSRPQPRLFPRFLWPFWSTLHFPDTPAGRSGAAVCGIPNSLHNLRTWSAFRSKFLLLRTAQYNSYRFYTNRPQKLPLPRPGNTKASAVLPGCPLLSMKSPASSGRKAAFPDIPGYYSFPDSSDRYPPHSALKRAGICFSSAQGWRSP